jgi:DNA polymerase V
MNPMSPVKLHQSSMLDLYSALTDTELSLPMASEKISAGFPSPANDFVDVAIDLNQHLIKHPSTTFFGRVRGQSMQDVGISDGDLLVIDKSLTPEDGKIAICFIDGEFTVKRIRLEKEVCYLIPANDAYKPIRVTAENEFLIWGIVTYVIKSF